MKRLYTIAFILLFLPGVSAQEPAQPTPEKFEVQATAQVRLGELVRIEVVGYSTDTGFDLKIFQQVPGQDVYVPADAYVELREPGKFVFSVPVAGSYTVRAVTYDQKSKAYLYAETVVVIGNPGPGPEPGPDPPDPTPVVGNRVIYVVRESQNDSPELARLFVALRKPDSYLYQKGHQLVVLDKDMPAAKAWVDYARSKNVNLPAVFICDPAKDLQTWVLYGGAVPMTYDGFIDLVKRHGG